MEDCIKQQLRLVPCRPRMLSRIGIHYTAVSRGTGVLQQGTGRKDVASCSDTLPKVRHFSLN